MFFLSLYGREAKIFPCELYFARNVMMIRNQLSLEGNMFYLPVTIDIFLSVCRSKIYLQDRILQERTCRTDNIVVSLGQNVGHVGASRNTDYGAFCPNQMHIHFRKSLVSYFPSVLKRIKTLQINWCLILNRLFLYLLIIYCFEQCETIVNRIVNGYIQQCLVHLS